MSDAMKAPSKETMSVPFPLRITPTMERVIDAMRGDQSKSDFVRQLVRDEYVKRVRYQGMKPIEKEQGGTDG